MTSTDLYAQADKILTDCQHDKRDCAVRFPGGQIVWVCCECWNRHVYARREARKTQLAELPRCEVAGCKSRGIFDTGWTGQTALLCGKHKRIVLYATAGSFLFGPLRVTREQILNIANR